MRDHKDKYKKTINNIQALTDKNKKNQQER